MLYGLVSLRWHRPSLQKETETMQNNEVEKVLDHIDPEKVKDYETYFNSLKPKNKKEQFRRGVFALASVHTTWELNVALYSELHDLKWLKNAELLRQRIIDSRAGLVNNRTKSYMLFAAAFWQFADMFDRKEGESWYGFRDRIEDTVHGLGPAKAAFYLELNHFHENRVACFDTHMFQLYGIKAKDVGKVKTKDMARMEVHWDMTCEKYNLNPVTARWLYWDSKQGKDDSRYWSYVLEKKPKLKREKQMELKVA